MEIKTFIFVYKWWSLVTRGKSMHQIIAFIGTYILKNHMTDFVKFQIVLISGHFRESSLKCLNHIRYIPRRALSNPPQPTGEFFISVK